MRAPFLSLEESLSLLTFLDQMPALQLWLSNRLGKHCDCADNLVSLHCWEGGGKLLSKSLHST